MIVARPGFFACVFASCGLIDLALAGTIYVDADATGANNGASWANAFNQLHDALAAATSGDEVWIAEGLYTPCDTCPSELRDPDLPRSAAFDIPSGVVVRGGFAGTETSPSQRDPDVAVNPVVLSGDFDADSDPTDNA